LKGDEQEVGQPYEKTPFNQLGSLIAVGHAVGPYDTPHEIEEREKYTLPQEKPCQKADKNGIDQGYLGIEDYPDQHGPGSYGEKIIIRADGNPWEGTGDAFGDDV
jgi:hypothetical protein